ncbi:MAG: hypothetical protein DRP42_06320 [Tenericutes bacterium]|nr:MAG: hypothetical protein DRP42_06320 [Mycoplasmatota bacterium]
MPTIVWRAIRTRRSYIDGDAVKKYISDGLMREVAPILIREHENIVADWVGRPEFEAKSFVHTTSLGVSVRPRGPVAKIWHWLSRGVAGHMVYPRIRNSWHSMRFTPRGGFGPVPPRRAVASRWTGVHSKGHWWPGILPRGFEQRIVEKVKPEFRRLAENILRRAMRRARRGRS